MSGDAKTIGESSKAEGRKSPNQFARVEVAVSDRCGARPKLNGNGGIDQVGNQGSEVKKRYGVAGGDIKATGGAISKAEQNQSNKVIDE